MVTEELAVIEDATKARAMLPALRQRILAAALEPISATGIAATLGLPRQRVNYHVRALATAGFLRRAGRRQRRGLVEQRWVVASRTIIVAPKLLAGLAPDHLAHEAMGPAYLLALATTVQREVAIGARVARTRGSGAPATLALDAELRFESAAQRARFAAAIQQSIAAAIAEHTTASANGPTYRLAFGCYPIPQERS